MQSMDVSTDKIESRGKVRLIKSKNTYTLCSKSGDRYAGTFLALALFGIGAAIQEAKFRNKSQEPLSQECLQASTFALVVTICQILHISHMGILTCRLFLKAASWYSRVHLVLVLSFYTLSLASLALFARSCKDVLASPHTNTVAILICVAMAWVVFLVLVVTFVLVYALCAWVMGPPTYSRNSPKTSGKGAKQYEVNFLEEADLGGGWLAKYINANGGRIGMAAGPGRKRQGVMDLPGDLEEIKKRCGEKVVLVTLFQPEEMDDMGYPKFLDQVSQAGIKCIHYSIRDKWFPEDMQSFVDLLQQDLVPLLLEGHTVLVHCFGGKGRTAVVVGGLLILFKQDIRIIEIVKIIRSRRPGMLKNILQRYYLFCFQRFLAASEEDAYDNP